MTKYGKVAACSICRVLDTGEQQTVVSILSSNDLHMIVDSGELFALLYRSSVMSNNFLALSTHYLTPSHLHTHTYTSSPTLSSSHILAPISSPYVPEISNGSYFGCIDMEVEDVGRSAVFTGSFFDRVYLNSSIQRDFSATCLNTVCLCVCMCSV